VRVILLIIFGFCCNLALKASVFFQPKIIYNNQNTVLQQILVDNKFALGHPKNELIIHFYYKKNNDTINFFTEKIKATAQNTKLKPYTFNHTLKTDATDYDVIWEDMEQLEVGINSLPLSFLNIKSFLTPIQLYSIDELGNKTITQDYYFGVGDSVISIASSLHGYKFQDSSIRYEISILKNNKKQSIIKTSTKIILNNFNKILEIEEKDKIDSLQSGNYIARIRIYDSAKIIFNEDKFFQKGNIARIDELNGVYLETAPKTIILETKPLSNTFVNAYDANTLKRNMQALTPLATPLEEAVIDNIADNINDTLKRNFFYNFWLERDAKNPEGAWKEYVNKLNYVAKQYGGGGMQGYKTDRGRIYLKYGVPTKTESAQNEKNARPYEVWQYDNIPGSTNIVFLFMNFNTYGNNMLLLHSTHPDEIFNPNWEQLLLQDRAIEHRVYEFLRSKN
jgi:GWxTD domain-containing protein